MSTAQLLRKFAFLSPFSDAQLEQLAERATRQRYPAGQVVFHIGDASSAMYLILSGEVSVHRYDEQGEEVPLGIMKTGQVFGELALLSGEPRMATITTLKDCEFLVIERDVLALTISSASPEGIMRLFAVLSNQIRTTNEREFQELLSKRMLAAEMETERQRSLTQMVAGVAHELNTPLGIINTAASIIERELDAPLFHSLAENDDHRQTIEDLHEALGLISGNIARAHHLVQDFKKVSVSQLTDVKEPMSISDAVNETVNLAKAHLRRSGLVIEVIDETPPEQREWVGYRGYLSQILLNFLTNIERYAYEPGAGGRADITIRCEDDDKFAISVKDYGKGMPEAVRARVFEPFFTTGRSSGGTGLGMAIVQNLVTTALKGAIQVQSEVGKGTEITVTFPRVIPG